MSNKGIEKEIRDSYSDFIEKGLLGPGSDVWGGEDIEETISDYPLIRYFTGILFPSKKKSISQADQDYNELESLLESDEYDEIEEIEDEFIKEHGDYAEIQSIKENNFKVEQNNFFPNNIAISVCIDANVEEVDAKFSFGVYYQTTLKERKIAISEEAYRSFFDNNIPNGLTFKDKLEYKDGFMFLNRNLEGFQGGHGNTRSGEYIDYDNFRKRENLKDHKAYFHVHKLEKLLGRAWKREQIDIDKILKVENTNNIVFLENKSKFNNNFKVGYHTKIYTHNDKQYLKIQLVNSSDKHPENKFSNKNETLNTKSIFQAKISVSSSKILSYRDVQKDLSYDQEAQIINYSYNKINSYGVGHNCAVYWEEINDKIMVSSTFLPKIGAPEMLNSLADIKDKIFNEALNIRNLSTFGKKKQEVIADLSHFIGFYKQWIDEQLIKSREDGNDIDSASYIIGRQLENYERIVNNIKLLADDNIFKVFQITNLAMLMQITISNDDDFSKNEKEADSINQATDYGNLNYFKNYDHNKLAFIPTYRPFQLAFLLLSLNGIIDKNSKSRNDIVDLIWFPTGGGKTEAYLAVAAFAIIWRRYKNADNYEGTTVIMRYTLRLLTSQQFERASRLITVLEFLRQQDEFRYILKTEPISIGLWIGMSSTPNKIDVAISKIDELEQECEKKNGYPQSKNAFQVSSCPWCGTKLITKTNGEWNYGFECSKRKKKFIIRCLNERCPFHSELPIQVIDEALYKNPPTLLFGTVDKFSMLAWNEDSYSFFNSHDNIKLPPDLIIQDELHLINGPLGSITGLFENIINLICTRDNVNPKIIASTATTRNTQHQVEQLYGDKSVNIFPPSGLEYDDSFFAKINDKTPKRAYLGIMPTGKSQIDTEINLLAHLLVARIKMLSHPKYKQYLNNYWTVVSYYNSLKDVGKISNKVGDEITTMTTILQNRFFRDKHKFNYQGLINRKEELTSRIQSDKIKSVLNKLSYEFSEERIIYRDGNSYLNNIVDLVLATNMISVGIDISRLNVMLLNGMPRNIAEYIQASSRIGRSTYGLAITLLNANRSREKSIFEHFVPFHQSFYKFIEPRSITSFTENTIEKMIYTLVIAYLRLSNPSLLSKDNQIKNFNHDSLKPLKQYFKHRYKDYPSELEYFFKIIGEVEDDLLNRLENGLEKYSQLLKRPSEMDSDDNSWIIMQSMREIDTSSYIRIREEK